MARRADGGIPTTSPHRLVAELRLAQLAALLLTMTAGAYIGFAVVAGVRARRRLRHRAGRQLPAGRGRHAGAGPAAGADDCWRWHSPLTRLLDVAHRPGAARPRHRTALVLDRLRGVRCLHWRALLPAYPATMHENRRLPSRGLEVRCVDGCRVALLAHFRAPTPAAQPAAQPEAGRPARRRSDAGRLPRTLRGSLSDGPEAAHDRGRLVHERRVSVSEHGYLRRALDDRHRHASRITTGWSERWSTG